MRCAPRGCRSLLGGAWAGPQRWVGEIWTPAGRRLSRQACVRRDLSVGDDAQVRAIARIIHEEGVGASPVVPRWRLTLTSNAICVRTMLMPVATAAPMIPNEGMIATLR